MQTIGLLLLVLPVSVIAEETNNSSFSSVSFNVDAYSKEELLAIRDIIDAKIREYEIQDIIENGDRSIEIVSPDELLYIGKTIKLTANVIRRFDSAPPNTKIIWVSSDPSVATVTSDGVIKGISNGEVEIKAIADDNELLFAVHKIAVISSVSEINLSESNISLLIGSTDDESKAVLSVIVLPEDAYDKSVSWVSSNTDVVTVDENGNLHAVDAGKAVISVQTNDVSLKRPIVAKCNVVVYQAVKSISLQEATINIGVGKTEKINATVEPVSASQKKIEYLSLDESIAKVSQAGIVTGVKAGTCEIVCKATDGTGIETRCTVNVNQLVTAIKIKETGKSTGEINLIEDRQKRLLLEFEPSDATDKSLKLDTSDPSIALAGFIDSELIINGGYSGTAIVTAEAQDGSGKKVTLKVNVEPYLSLEYIDSAGYTEWGFHSFLYTLKNISKYRTVDGITIRYYADDVYGNKLRAYGYGDYEREETLNVTIKPGEKKRLPQITAYGFNEAKRLHIYISKVHYTDGTTIETESFGRILTFGK